MNHESVISTVQNKKNKTIIMYFTSVFYNSLDRKIIYSFVSLPGNRECFIYAIYTVGNIYSTSFVPQADLNLVYKIMLPSQILQQTIKLSSDKTYTITN